MPLFKIWNDLGKKSIMAESLSEIIQKSGQKFGVDVKRVRLSDGTEVEDDEVVNSLPPGTVLQVETDISTPEPCAPMSSQIQSPALRPLSRESSLGSDSSSDTVILDPEERLSMSINNRKRKLLNSPPPSSDENSPTCSQKTNLPNPLELPENLPHDVVHILESKPYHPQFYQARVKMVKKVREFFSGMCPYPTAEEYLALVKCIGDKFPHLCDPGTKESDPPRQKFASLLMQLQQAFRNARRKSLPTGNKKAKQLVCIDEKVSTADDESTEVDEEGYGKMCNEIEKQLQSSTVNENVIEKLMAATFDIRRKWIHTEDYMSITKICNKFPSLKYPIWVLFECSKVTALGSIMNQVSANRDKYFKPLRMALGLYDEDGEERESCVDNNVQFLKILELVQGRLCKTNDTIMHETKVGCNLKDLFLKKGNEPFMVVIKDKSKISQIFIGAERKELFEIQDGDLLTAVAVLVSCYYAFNVEYQRGKNYMLFLQEFLLGIPCDSKRNSKYGTFYKQMIGYLSNDKQND